jgi:hypothetical protein
MIYGRTHYYGSGTKQVHAVVQAQNASDPCGLTLEPQLSTVAAGRRVSSSFVARTVLAMPAAAAQGHHQYAAHIIAGMSMYFASTCMPEQRICINACVHLSGHASSG